MSASSTSATEASRGSAVRLSAEVVIRLSSVVGTLWLTRSLGVSTFGVFLLALSIGLLIAEVCDMGLNSIVVPLVVKSQSSLRTLFLLKSGMTLAVAALCAPLIPAASWFSGVASGVLALTTVHFVGASWIEMAGTALRALGRRVDEAVLLFVFRFTLVGLIIGAPFGTSVESTSVAYAAAILPALGVGAWFLKASFSGEGSDAPSVRSILQQAAPMGLNSYLAIASTRVEIFLLQAFRGEYAVGLFGGALRIVESLLTLPSAIAGGALPAVAKDVLTGSRGAAQRTFGLVVWMAVPAALGLVLCAPGILHVLGPGFVEGAPALRVLALALFLCFSNAALIHVLIAAGQTGVIPRLTGLRVGVALAAGLVLIPTAGLVGGAASFTIAEFSLFLSLLHQIRPFVQIEVARPVACAAIASAPMSALLLLWPLPLAYSVLTGALAFVAMGAALLRRGTVACGLS